MSSSRAREVLGFRTEREYMEWAMRYLIIKKNKNNKIEIS
jgi:hypothetical protein